MRFRDIVLASTSPARRALLHGLGVPFRAIPPAVEEVIPPGTPCHDAVLQLGRRKAEAVQRANPDSLVIGADQMVEVDGAALNKPADRDAARAQLARLLGRTHDILTGVCVLAPGFDEARVDVARPTFYAVAPEELEAYLDTGEWEGCAGGYRIEGAGQALVERLEGDRASVQGLPMILLVGMLRRAGVKFFGD